MVYAASLLFFPGYPAIVLMVRVENKSEKDAGIIVTVTSPISGCLPFHAYEYLRLFTFSIECISPLNEHGDVCPMMRMFGYYLSILVLGWYKRV
jgi:hypothetical protein